MIIDKVKFNNKNKLYIIETEDISFEISEITLAKFNLYKGKEIEVSDINDILYSNEVSKGKDIALRYLSSMRTEKEVRDKLSEKEINPDAIDDVINYLINEKFINDYEYALFFSRDKLNINKYGINKIRDSMRIKGLNSNIIEEALDKLPYEKQYENLMTAAKRKFYSLSNDDKRKEKLIRHLLYKGYEYSMIKYALEDLKYIIEKGDCNE